MAPQLYERGDVVWCYLIFEDRRETKPRPVVILEAYSDSYLVCKITGTDYSQQRKGRWISSNMAEYRTMGLTKDSFIDFERQAEMSYTMFNGKIGECPFVDEIEIL